MVRWAWPEKSSNRPMSSVWDRLPKMVLRVMVSGVVAPLDMTPLAWSPGT